MKRILLITLSVLIAHTIFAKPATPDTTRLSLFQSVETAISENNPSVYQLLDDFTSRYGVTADALTLQGLLHYSDGDHETGLSTLHRALESITAEDLIDRSALLMAIAGKIDDPFQRLDYINAAIDANPKNSNAYAARARLYSSTGFLLREAESDAKKAIKYSGGNPSYRALLCRIHIMQDKSKQALKEANALIREYPDYPHPYYLRSVLMKFMNNTENHIDDYLIYLQLSHDLDFEPMIEVADTHYEYIMEFAGQILKKALARENIAFWNFFIEEMKSYAKDPTAIENLNTALQYAVEQELVCRLYLAKSRYYLNRSQYDSALIFTQHVIDTVEMNGGIGAYWLYQNKGAFLSQLKRYADADTAYTVALTRNIEDSTDHSDLFFLRSKLRFDYLRDSLSALSDLDSALTYTPHSCYVLYAHARLSGLLGHIDQATADYELILLLDTTVTPDSYRHFAFAALGRRAEAEAWLSQVIDQNDNERLKPSILYNAACMYSLLNDPQTAVKYLMDAMTLSPIDCDQIRNDEDFANIRTTPEFQSILRVACSDNN